MCIVRGLEAEGKVALVTLVWHLPGVCLHVLRQQGGVMEHLAAVLALQGRGVDLLHVPVQLLLLAEVEVALSAAQQPGPGVRLLLLVLGVVEQHGLGPGVGLTTFGAWTLIHLKHYLRYAR